MTTATNNPAPQAPQQPAPAQPAQPPKPAPPPKPAAPQNGMTKPVASAAKMRRRHHGVLISFFIVVVLPLLLTGYYLWSIAADQYVSRVGFSVRAERGWSPSDLLGGLGAIGGLSGGASDMDILYEFIQSEEMVRAVDTQLDLRMMYARPDFDPVFAFRGEGSIEDLTRYWNRMVRLSYDSGAGLLEIRVRAFDPEDAKLIADEIYTESTRMINELSAIARDDTTRFTREALAQTVERLKAAREAMMQFRSENQIVDPAAELGVQTGLMTALQQQLSDALITLDLLEGTGNESDPRIEQARQRISVIRERITEEREKFGTGGRGDYSTLIAEYERLQVDLQFAQQAYVAAQAAFDGAQAEAGRQSRYLALYATPQIAERPLYPQRGSIALLTGLFLLLGWAIAILIFYSIKDRR